VSSKSWRARRESFAQYVDDYEDADIYSAAVVQVAAGGSCGGARAVSLAARRAALADEQDPLLSRSAAAAEEVYLDALVRNLEKMTALQRRGN
jgi:hypothetical protein